MNTKARTSERACYTITSLESIHKPQAMVYGCFNVFKVEPPPDSDGMEYKVVFQSCTTNERFFKDLEGIVSTMKGSKEERIIFTRITKKAYIGTESTFGQISAKYGCCVFKLDNDGELIRINVEELVDKNFEGSCTFEVYDAYSGEGKAVFLDIREIVVNGPLTQCEAEED